MQVSWHRIKSKETIVFLFFVVLFIYGCLVWRDYGVSVDEIYERNSSLVTYKYLVPSVSGISTDSVNFNEVESLLDWHDRYYGVAMQLPMVFIEHIFKFNIPINQVLMMRHMYVFLLFFIASYIFYRTAKRLSGSTYFALLGTAIFVLCPRILADSFYNIKDSLFLSVFTINLYAAVLFMDKPSWKRMIVLSVATAFCVNTRIVGAVLIAICLCIVFIRSIILKKLKQALPLILGAGALSIGFYVIITPITWHDPLGEIWNIYQTFSNYTTWHGTCYYMGQYYNATELPWHYLPGWILITVPFSYSLLAAVGAVVCVLQKKLRAEYWLVLLGVLVPILYVIVTRPVLYNGWRHFYFIYALIALLAMWGGQFICEKVKGEKWKWFPRILLIGMLIWICIRIGVYHPYGYAYFNPIVEQYADDYFEKDYWGMTSQNLLEYMLKHDDRSSGINIRMWLNWAANGLSEAERMRFDFSEIQDADYITWQSTGSVDSPDALYYFYNKEHEERVRDMTLGVLYDGHWDLCSTSIITENPNEGKLKYNINGIAWEYNAGDTDTELSGKLPAAINTGYISLEVPDEGMAHNITVSVLSGEGEWQNIHDLGGVEYDGRIIHARFDQVVEVCGIRILHGSVSKNLSWRINLHRLSYEADNSVDYSEFSPFEVVASSHQDAEHITEYAVDNDNSTYWTGGYQEKEMVYAFTMNESYSLCAVAFEMGDQWYDYPRNLRIFVSDNELDWNEVSYQSADNKIYYFEPQECRYVRLVLGEMDDNVNNHWTIQEILLFEEK